VTTNPDSGPDPEARPTAWTAADEAAWKAQGWTQATWEAAAADEAEAAYEALYGTPTEQAADAVEAEVEAIVAEAWSAYGTDSYFISGPDDLDEPEADL
jgi:hypothetical protein